MTAQGDHPFLAVLALARAEADETLEHMSAYDGALHRLFCKKPQVVFRLETDPGSAIDRQAFDYFHHIKLTPDTPEGLLAVIRNHIATLEQGSRERSNQ
jgi:hypothetical protein